MRYPNCISFQSCRLFFVVVVFGFSAACFSHHQHVGITVSALIVTPRKYNPSTRPHGLFLTGSGTSGEQHCESEEKPEVEEKSSSSTATTRTRTNVAFHKAWMAKYRELVEYKRIHGDTLVPLQYSPNPRLSEWVNNQRQIYRGTAGLSRNMPQERIDLLDQLGFEWSVRDMEWRRVYEQLVRLQKQTKVCQPTNPKLRQWLLRQGVAYRKGKLSSKRIKLLEQIPGFDWDGLEIQKIKFQELWMRSYHELVENKKQHGDCLVPRAYKENPALSSWIRRQRLSYSQGRLLPERVAMLNDLGFDWSMENDVGWPERFQQLQEYKQCYGDCLVPRNYKDNPKLASWVDRQRKAYRSQHITSERIRLLESIGFQWTSRRSSSSSS